MRGHARVLQEHLFYTNTETTQNCDRNDEEIDECVRWGLNIQGVGGATWGSVMLNFRCQFNWIKNCLDNW
jgi:hypothetical protein